MAQQEKQEKYDLKADAEFIINKYKCKYAAGQYWYLDNNKWVSASNSPLSLIITREFGERYKSSFTKIEQIEKFVKNITQDKYRIDIKKSFSVYFLNGIVEYDKNCYYDSNNLLKYEKASFKPYKTEEEKSTFTPAIINDTFIGTIGSESLNILMSTSEGQEIKRVVDKYYNFLAMDQNNIVREEVRDYLLALGWICHSTATLEQITYLLGDGANGKSWYTNKVLYSLVGRQNFGAFKLDKINGDFGYQPFLNKTLMVDPDAKNSLIEDDKFKSLAGTDVVNINIKNKDPISTELFSTVILCTNHMPKYVDYSSSMSRRMVLIKLESCVYENMSAAKKIKTKYTLSDAEQKVFFSDLSKQYQRSLMFDAFCRMYDVESKLLNTPVESTQLNQDLERENNELYAWCEEENWIQKALADTESNEIFVYPQYVYDKYKEYYKENNDGSDKGFTLKKNGVWQRFKELMESKYRGTFIFDTNQKLRMRIGGAQPLGFMIKAKDVAPSQMTTTQLEQLINHNSAKIQEFLEKIESLKLENETLNKVKVSKQDSLNTALNSETSKVVTTPVVTDGKEDK